MSKRPFDVLTPREREVLALLGHGLTNEEIAHRLDISLDGAKYHVSQILSKLGVPTREEAAVWRPEERRAAKREAPRLADTPEPVLGDRWARFRKAS